MRYLTAVIISSFIVGGCAAARYSSFAYEQKLGQWIGKSVNTLYTDWGDPQQIIPLNGSTIMATYYQSETQPIDGDFEPYAGVISFEAMEQPQYGLPPAPPLYYCKTSFIITNGIVTDYQFNGDDCR